VQTVDDTGDSRARRVRRSDAIVPGLLGIVGAVEIVGAGYRPLWVTLGTYWLAAAVLCGRRAAPLVMAPAVAAIYALTPILGADVSEPASWLLLIPFACLSTGLHVPRPQRVAGLACVLVALAITLAGLAWLTDFDPNLVFGLCFSVGPWALGVALREALERSRRVSIEVERARAERALAAERAAASERNRIASELHDALAHALGAMVVQAAVASDLIRRDRAAAAAALGDLAQAGRDALAETGRLLRLIRDDRDELGLQRTPTLAARPSPAVAVGRDASIPLTDLLLPALFGIVGTVELAWEAYEPLWASIGTYWLAVAVLCVRRALPLAMPVAVAAIVVGAAQLGVDTDDPASWILPLALAYFATGLYVRRSRAAAGLASVLASSVLIAIDAGPRASWEVLWLIAFAVGPWAIGVALRQTRERIRALAATAARARLEREVAVERAATAERKRIARELHDVLAKSLSVMIVQASLAADLVVVDPASAASAVAEVERSGRTALGETGRLLRLIEGGTDALGTHPQPGVADLPALADDYARAGLAIDLELDDDARRLPLGVELSSYRIVQEALTNALKHAPGSPVRIRLSRHGSEVAIEVRNGRASSSALGLVPSGHGLAGLRERVSLFGGTFDASPTDDGGFVLAATLPVDAETA
jgi:signal transduction histidine kinase